MLHGGTYTQFLTNLPMIRPAQDRLQKASFFVFFLYLVINMEHRESHEMFLVCPAWHVLKVESSPYQIIKEHPQAIHTRIAL